MRINGPLLSFAFRLPPSDPWPPRRIVRSSWLAVSFLLMIGALPAFRAEIVDRVAAVVNDRVITLSDVEWSFIYSQTALPDDAAKRKKATDDRLNQMIEQELAAQEVEKEPSFVLREEEVAAELKKLELRHGGREKLESEAGQMGLSQDQLRLTIRRQLSVLKFIDLRIRPFVIVLPDEIATYYRETLVPELKDKGISTPPPQDEVREQIEKLLIEQKVDQELDQWLSNARKRAKIFILLYREESPNMPPEKWTKSKQ
ncbi:MAG: SurA N-terminal domain-containing protein [Acidobacteria bacterium]|nr:SurA N-terminal domain-containing protein [Acidobacteriota bacterium]